MRSKNSLHTDEHYKRFVYSNIEIIINEIINILDDHYYEICSHILKLETVKFVCIVDKYYNILYGICRRGEEPSIKDLTFIKDLQTFPYKVLKTGYGDIRIYEHALSVELEDYKMIINMHSTKQINIIQDLLSIFI